MDFPIFQIQSGDVYLEIRTRCAAGGSLLGGIGDRHGQGRRGKHRPSQAKRSGQLNQVVEIEIAFAIACYPGLERSVEHTSELQSLMRISYDVFCLTTKNTAK